MGVVTMPNLERQTEIEVREELAVVTDEAVDALAARGGGGLFVRGGVLVRMAKQERLRAEDEPEPEGTIHREAGTLFISEAPVPYIREQLDRAACWWKRKYDRTKQKHVRASALPPSWVAETIAARGAWPFPVLNGVTTTPLLRADGSILQDAGYDPATGFYLAPDMEYWEIQKSPTARDAGRSAVELAEVYCDFPFVSDSDRAAAIGLPLSILGRPAITGPVPMTAFRAPTPGTGKTLLADVGFRIALGHTAPRTSPSNDDNEMRKLLLSIGLAGDAAVLLDDVTGNFGSSSLDAALTAMEISGRLLGLNKTACVPMRTVFAITGNNLGFRGALGRRVIPCDIDAGVENPEERKGPDSEHPFTHPDLLGWLASERPRLVVACLTLLRAYIVAGRPGHGLPPKGSFEAWDALIRGALIWSGIGDPLGGQKRLREESDSDLDALRAGLAAWEGVFGAAPATAAEAIRRTASDKALLSALATFTGCDEARLDARRLGYALRRHRGRPFNGRRFIREGEDRLAGVLWSVKVDA